MDKICLAQDVFFLRPRMRVSMQVRYFMCFNENVEKTRRVRSVSVGKIWVVRKDHFGVTACGSRYGLLHFSQLAHIVNVEVG